MTLISHQPSQLHQSGHHRHQRVLNLCLHASQLSQRRTCLFRSLLELHDQVLGHGGLEDAKPVDTAGKLPSGETFEDFAGLKAILMTSQRRTVVRNVVKTTLAYALCRQLGRHDQPTVDAITDHLCATDGTWKNLFTQIANSVPFRETIIPPDTDHE